MNRISTSSSRSCTRSGSFKRSSRAVTAQRDGNVRRAHDRSPLSLALDGTYLGHPDEVLDVLVSLPFPPFLVREAVSPQLLEQILDSGLQDRRGPERDDLLR